MPIQLPELICVFDQSIIFWLSLSYSWKCNLTIPGPIRKENFLLQSLETGDILKWKLRAIVVAILLTHREQ